MIAVVVTKDRAVLEVFPVVLSYFLLALAFIFLLKLPGIIFASIWHLAKPLAMVGFGFLLGLSFPAEAPAPVKQSHGEQPQKWLTSNFRTDDLPAARTAEPRESLGTILLTSAVDGIQDAAGAVLGATSDYMADSFAEADIGDLLSHAADRLLDEGSGVFSGVGDSLADAIRPGGDRHERYSQAKTARTEVVRF